MAATREALIAAGMVLFAEKGLDGPSLDEICARAGFTRGAFYVHFEGRDDFLVAVMDRVGSAYLDAVIASGGAGDDLAVTIGRFLASVASGAYPLTGPRGVRPHQLLDACARSPKIRARYVALVADALARIAAAVNVGQGAERLRDDVPAADVAAMLMAAVIGAQTMMELEVPLDPAGLAAGIMKMLQPGSRRNTRK